ncbi:MAG: efflux RND transporter permease subunit [Myxococcota bacterium]|nr:efflux RND transporter permease subunit [Myxococcota bacterium]
MSDLSKYKGPIAWMAKNSVAANLFMFILLFAGVVGLFQTKQEVLPEFDLDIILVEVPYPGATPEEVEQGIVLALEEAVIAVDGVKVVTGTASESRGYLTVELLLGSDTEQVLNDIKSAVDRITTFPELAEKPSVRELSLKREVISLVISGDQELSTLHDIAERARRELKEDPNITQIGVKGVPERELSVTVPQVYLEAHKLTLGEIAQQIRLASIDLSGGGVKTDSGEVLLRVADRKQDIGDFGDIIIRSSFDGAELRLGDIAQIEDGYEETELETYFNDQRAVVLTIYRIGEETPTAVANAVKSYSKVLQKDLPSSIQVSVWEDSSELLKGRINLLLDNARVGLILVFLILALFLEFRLAFWVSLGIPISFLGSFVLLGNTDATINMVSLFAYIVTLGLVVDDAIVVGENIYEEHERGKPWPEAAIVGAQRMVVPVTFAILTSIAAFAPLLVVPGVSGKFFKLIPTVVICVLILSLIESFFVLPAHLGHMKDKEDGAFMRAINYPQKRVSALLKRFIEGPFDKIVRSSTTYRYTAFSAAIAMFFVAVGLVAGGIVPFSFFPQIEGDRITVSAKLPYGAPIEQTLAVQREIAAAGERAVAQLGDRNDLVLGMLMTAGEGSESRTGRPKGSHLTTVQMSMVPSENRSITTKQISEAWQAEIPSLPGIESIKVSAATGPGAGAAIDIQIISSKLDILEQASDDLTERLRGYPSLIEIENSLSSGKSQLDFKITDSARSLGLSSTDIGQQLRASFYGAEALREQVGRLERKTMVRLPPSERMVESDIVDVRIRTPQGGFVPLGELVVFERGVSPTTITREGGNRIVNVKAGLAPGVRSSREVLTAIQSKDFTELRAKYPDVQLELVGEQRDQGETFASLGRNFLLALFAIYALLAIPFKSYVQPFIIMSAIPFGFVGAVLGHLFMGFEMSIISMFGTIALTGVVVNDSLVLIDSANQYRKNGASPFEAVVQGAKRRFRPILLTSLTTFLGLAPMILEQSMQARFLIPMAISLGFGVLFATFIILLVVPALYMIVEDILAPFPWQRKESLPDALPTKAK